MYVCMNEFMFGLSMWQRFLRSL